MSRPDVRCLAVVTHVPHVRHGDTLWAYAPYARELAVWASLVPALRVVAPVRAGAPAGDDAPIAATNVTLAPVPAAPASRLARVVALPRLARRIARALAGADAVHVRCPGLHGAIGAVIAPRGGRRVVAKYAGHWGAYPGEPLASRVQRAWLASACFPGPVTVYGGAAGDPPHVIPFFTSVLDGEALARAAAVAAARTPGAPLRVLFVGRLTPEKAPGAVLDAVAALPPALVSSCTLVGDGPLARALAARVAGDAALAGRVTLAGALPFARVLDAYAAHDVVVLASRSEGWPKVLAEAMAFGCVAIGPDRGFARTMLGEGRGVLVPPGDAAAIAAALRALAADPARHAATIAAAAPWAATRSLATLGDALARLLAAWWGAAPPDDTPSADTPSAVRPPRARVAARDRAPVPDRPRALPS